MTDIDAAAIPFVDAHVHFWDLSRLRYDWLTPPFGDGGPNGDVTPIAATYLPADYRAETAAWNVVGAVHIEAGAAAAQALDETRWLEGMADADGLPTGIVAHADLADPAIDAQLAAQQANPRVRGIRQIVNWHVDADRTYTARDLIQDAAWRRGLGVLARTGLSFDLQCYPSQMADIAALLARHDGLPVMINHTGMPVMSDRDAVEQWRAGLRALATLPQVAIKLSGPGFIWRDWSVDRIRPFLLEAIDLFGPDRTMFASDLPTDRLFGSVGHHLTAYHAIVAAFTLAERRLLFGGTANRLYRLGLDLEKHQ